MARIRITPAAKAHLKDIWQCTESTWGEAQADAYLGVIKTALQKLAKAPQLGVARPEVRKGCRSLPVKKHVLFYTITDEGEYVNILAVLHAQMDVGSWV